MSEDYRLCPICQTSVAWDDMIWLNGEATCPKCYEEKRRALEEESDSVSKIRKE